MLAMYAGIVLLVYFATPTSVSLGIGAGLLFFGELLRIWAAGHLEKNKDLCTSGPYAHVKNPLYVGTFLIMVGFLITGWNLYALGIGAIGIVMFFAYYLPYKKRREGEKLRKLFGERFEDYDAKVPDFIPRLQPYPGSRGRWRMSVAVKNSEHWTCMAVLMGWFAIGLRFWIGS